MQIYAKYETIKFKLSFCMCKYYVQKPNNVHMFRNTQRICSVCMCVCVCVCVCVCRMGKKTEKGKNYSVCVQNGKKTEKGKKTSPKSTVLILSLATCIIVFLIVSIRLKPIIVLQEC